MEMEEIKRKFEKIYDTYNAKIYRFVYLKVSSLEIAEDLSSEVFLKLWSSFTSAKIENIQAYTYRIASNVIADYYKARANTQTVALENTAEIIDTKDRVEETAQTNMEMERVKEALKGINDDYQNFIIWRYLDELSVPEIAQIIGKSEESVRVGVHRALEALRMRLGASTDRV